MADKSKPPMGAKSLFAADAMRTAASDPNYAALTQYLQSRGRMPSVDTAGYLGGGADGEYQGGKITIRRGLPPAAATGVLTHELVHAADEAMSGQFFQRAGEMGVTSRNAPWGQNQFMDAYRKLYRDPSDLKSNPRLESAAALAPDWAKNASAYRTGRNEIPAWAVGRFSGQDGMSNAAPHVDASAATDFMVLLDLAQRDAQKGPAAPAPGILDYLKNLLK